MTEISCVLDWKAGTGESPVWSVQEQVLYWTDMPSKQLHRFDPATGLNTVTNLPEELCSFALRKNGGIVAAMWTGFAFVDFETGAVDFIHKLFKKGDDQRMNDGRCDRFGNFYAGSMDLRRKENTGVLYRLDPDLNLTEVCDNVMVSNGLAWTNDSTGMWWSDTFNQKLYHYDFDAKTGRPSNRRLILSYDDEMGRPDGATVDEEGYYWTACYRGGKIYRMDASGRIDRTVQMPVKNVTMCAFGGPDLSTLFVTTATDGMPPEQLAAEPWAGSLLAFEPGVRGVEEVKFSG